MTKIFNLTIDDGPNDDFITRVKVLESRGIKAIWYCLGNQLELHEEKVIKAIKFGHVIGNHGYDHQSFSDLSLEGCYEQINRTDQIIDKLYKEAGIKRPYKTFRFPYLDMGDGSLEPGFHYDHPKVSAINRYLMSIGYAQPNFMGQPPVSYSELLLNHCIGLSATFDTKDWSINQMDQSGHIVDEHSLLEITKNNLDKMIEKDGYEIVLSHSFVPLETSLKLIDMILDAGYNFHIPKEAQETGLIPLKRNDDHHNTKHPWSKTHPGKKETDLVLIGDSITRRWEDYDDVFKTYFEEYTCANYGVGGDTTNNLIWRLQDGLLDNVTPKVIVLLIGTNNLGSYCDPAIIKGITYIIDYIQTQCPSASLIVNGIFPRNRDHQNIDYNKRIKNINDHIIKHLSKDTIYVDMAQEFIGDSPLVSQDLMPDGLHINENGYHMWGKVLKPLIKKAMVK